MNVKKILETHIGSILKVQHYIQITLQYTACQIVVYL